MNRDIELKPVGWCSGWLVCRVAGDGETLCVPGQGERCSACWAADLGLPAGSSAGAVVAELVRRDGSAVKAAA